MTTKALQKAIQNYKINRFKETNRVVINRIFIITYGYKPTQIAFEAFAEMLWHYNGDLRIQTIENRNEHQSA